MLRRGCATRSVAVSSSIRFSSASCGIGRGKTRAVDSSRRSCGREGNSATSGSRGISEREKSDRWLSRVCPGARRPREVPSRIPGDAREPRGGEAPSIFHGHRRPIGDPACGCDARHSASRRGAAWRLAWRLASLRFARLGSARTPLRSAPRGETRGHIRTRIPAERTVGPARGAVGEFAV